MTWDMVVLCGCMEINFPPFGWRDSQHVVVDCPLFTSNSRILCPVCCILHLALQDLETQVHLWTKHRHTGLTVNFNSNGAGTRCLTSPRRDLGSNGQSSCLVFIFVNENDTTRIWANSPTWSWPGELHAGCHSPMCLGAPLLQWSVTANEFRFWETDTFFVVVCVCHVLFLHITMQFCCVWFPWPVQSMETRLVETKFAYLELILSTVGVLDLLVNLQCSCLLLLLPYNNIVSCTGDGGNGHMCGIPRVYQFLFRIRKTLHRTSLQDTCPLDFAWLAVRPYTSTFDS